MKLLNIVVIVASLVGCAHCGPKDGDEPNIRTQPGIEYCGDMCKKFKDLNCVGYYEDIEIDCASDPTYMTMPTCQASDGGIVNLTCKEFCEYEMKNSIQLNPKCLSENLMVCSEIETICL
jgi:hypothetical protein